jgi:hypothetical protein
VLLEHRRQHVTVAASLIVCQFLGLIRLIDAQEQIAHPACEFAVEKIG